MLFLPDTNTIIAVTNKADRRIGLRLRDVRHAAALSSIVLYELYFGAFNSAREPSNLAEVDGLRLAILPFDREDARAAAEVRATLKRAGTPIGPYDLLIAGQALARGLIVVTANVREFARVQGLRLENWHEG